MNKKISFIIYSLDCGGAERVVTNLANYFSKNNSVEILTFSLNPPFYPLNAKIKCFQILYKDFNESFLFIFNPLSRILALRKLFRERKDHVFISFTSTMNIISIIANIFLNRKLLISQRNDPIAENLSFTKRFLRFFLYPLSSHLIVQSKTQKAFYKHKILRSKISIISNPISNHKKISFEDDSVNIVNIGRLVEQKNHFDLINAYVKSNLQCKLYIIGEGPMRKKLSDYIKSLKKEDKIFLLGLRSDVYEFLNPNWIFASTSIFEGFPNALLEAMNAGLSCIHYDCPSGINEIINDRYNGILSPLNDTDFFSSKLIELFNNKSFRDELGANASNSLKYLDINSIGNKWLDLM